MHRRLLLLLPSSTYRAAAFLDAARRIGVAVTVGTDHHSTLEADQPENFLALDFADPHAAAAQARAFHARTPLDAVFGVDDATVVIAAHVAGAIGAPSIGVRPALAARDKHLQRVLLARGGVRVPPFALHHFGDDLGAGARRAPYPCVLKPLRLSASRGVIRADDPAGFVAAAERIRAILAADDAGPACGDTGASFLVERYVPGAEVALEGLLRDGRLTVLALFDKPDPLDGPYFEETIYVTPSALESARQREIAVTVEQAAAALGLTRGPVHAELRIDARGAWLIELAARPIGGRCGAVLRFGKDGGTSLEELHLRAALGLEVPLDREPAAAAVMMIPTTGAGVFRGVDGVEEARAVPHVEDVMITVHRGQALVPLPEAARYLGFIFARAAEPRAAEAAVRAAHARLHVHLEGPPTERRAARTRSRPR